MRTRERTTGRGHAPPHRATARVLAVALLALAAAACKPLGVSADARAPTPDGGVPGRSCSDGAPHNWKPEDPGEAVSLGPGGGLANLFDVWGASPTQVFAVGSQGKVIYYDGKTWKAQATPTKQDLTAVWGSSATDVWAVGFGGTVLQFDGQTWQDRSPPPTVFVSTDGGVPTGDAAVAARRNLWGVWAAPQAVYAAGDRGAVVFYNGTVWTRVASGVEEKLADVWGAGPNQVFIVGDFGTVLSGSSTGLTKAQTGTAKQLRAVWGRGGNDVYAVGLAGTLLHFNGSKWEAVEGTPKQFFRAVWGPADDGSVIYVVGWDGSLLRVSGGPSYTNGATFDLYDCITARRLEGIWGTARTGRLDAGVPRDGGPLGTNVAWIVGVSGTVIVGP
ncbi:MAG: hypothetical protein IT371_01290 [Deltaproteobacteria bacterium]|nr:hypothetical protein [Deltaproteobacteria bacterium]